MLKREKSQNCVRAVFKHLMASWGEEARVCPLCFRTQGKEPQGPEGLALGMLFACGDSYGKVVSDSLQPMTQAFRLLLSMGLPQHIEVSCHVPPPGIDPRIEPASVGSSKMDSQASSELQIVSTNCFECNET